jgi:hypothetical protein
MDARAQATALEDLPPKREKPPMTADERSKLQKELIAARDRQTSGFLESCRGLYRQSFHW